MPEEQLNFFHILLQEEISRELLLINQYFEEFNMKEWHSLQDICNASGNCKDWWYSRWLDFFRFQKQWTESIQERVDYFDKVWNKYSNIIQRSEYEIQTRHENMV